MPALDTTSSQNVTADTEDIARARLRSSRRSCLELIAQVDHGKRGLINVAQDAPKSRLKSMPWIKGMYVRVSAPITREKLAVLILRDFGDNHSKVSESSLILNERIIQHSIRQRIGTLYISDFMNCFDARDKERNYVLMRWLLQLAMSGEFRVVLR